MRFAIRWSEEKTAPRANLMFSPLTTVAHRITLSLSLYKGIALVPSLVAFMNQSCFLSRQDGAARETAVCKKKPAPRANLIIFRVLPHSLLQQRYFISLHEAIPHLLLPPPSPIQYMPSLSRRMVLLVRRGDRKRKCVARGVNFPSFLGGFNHFRQTVKEKCKYYACDKRCFPFRRICFV